MNYSRWSRHLCAIGAVLALGLSGSHASAQGVTTASVTGVVKDAQGGVIPGATVEAVHDPSGTTYDAVTRADGRFIIQGMRVGGPYKVSAALSGFTTEVKNNLTWRSAWRRISSSRCAWRPSPKRSRLSARATRSSVRRTRAQQPPSCARI